MSVELLETASAALGDLTAEVVFVGASTLPLWMSERVNPFSRVTFDVDIVVSVASRLEFHRFEQRLREIGFSHDIESRVICRWRHAESGLILDAVPTDASILGFASRWLAAGVPHALSVELPSGATINCVSPPYLFAAKLEAFADRGKGAYLGSKDFEDIVGLVDGRSQLVEELAAADSSLRDFVGREVSRMVDDARFVQGVIFSLGSDPESELRGAQIALPRLRTLAEFAN